MATDKKPETMPDLDDLLQCPVCYEMPSGQIFQCNEGHHVCGRCKARLSQCPVCRALFFGTRNYAMEELIANIRKFQSFKLGGKMTVTGAGGSESNTSADNSTGGNTINESLEDENETEPSNSNSQVNRLAPPACKGLFRCLCCKGENPSRLPAARLLNHLRYYHAQDLIEGNADAGEYIQTWQIPTDQGRSVIAVRVVHMGVFFLIFEITNVSICAWVSMAAGPWIANSFRYTLTISGNDRQAIFNDSVWSVRNCEGTLKKRGRCLLVNGQNARALSAGGTFSGRLTLKREEVDELFNQEQPRAMLRVADRGTTVQDITQPTADRVNNMEPLLQGLQNNVDRLARAFANIGRSLNLDSIEEVLHPRNEPPVPPTSAPAALSRSARRRMRNRLRAALDTPPDSPNVARVGIAIVQPVAPSNPPRSNRRRRQNR